MILHHAARLGKTSLTASLAGINVIANLMGGRMILLWPSSSSHYLHLSEQRHQLAV
jgi:hypothetical protein